MVFETIMMVFDGFSWFLMVFETIMMVFDGF
jgi:hypothetical protein